MYLLDANVIDRVDLSRLSLSKSTLPLLVNGFIIYYYTNHTLIMPISTYYYSGLHNAVMSYARVQFSLTKVQ